LAAYTSETIRDDHVGGSYVVDLFKQKVVGLQKNDILATVATSPVVLR